MEAEVVVVTVPRARWTAAWIVQFLRLCRQDADVWTHKFRKVGVFPAMHELQTKWVCFVRVVLSDVVQRPRPTDAWTCVRLDAAL